MIGASCALNISGIPFKGPIGAVRIGRIDDKFKINPSFSELHKSSLVLVVAFNHNGVMMIEGFARQIDERLILDAIKFGQEYAFKLIEIQEELRRKVGKTKKQIELRKSPEELIMIIKEKSSSKLKYINTIVNKEQRMEELDLLSQDLIEELVTQDSDYTKQDITGALNKVEKEEVRKVIIEQKRRIDGRSYDQLRPITCEVGIFPRTHGSGLFTRGETQSLVITTLGSSGDEQKIDALEGETFKRFMLHYNFPPFSVGETRPIRGPGRREIGHGALAEKTLQAIIPQEENFPYTVRIVSDILESNGSSSMAAVCGSSLSLMDAGVPTKAQVAGVALGLIKEEQNKIILVDISGLEDHCGDMDFKIAGTRNGITGIQLDLKIDGLSLDIIEEALNKAGCAREKILQIMDKAISKPRESVSIYAPKIAIIKVNPDKVSQIIGPGGKMIRKIIEQTGVTIDIKDYEGKVVIASENLEQVQKVVNIIKDITKDVQIGDIYEGKIKKIANFGAFCEISPGKDGLIRISELSKEYIKRVEDVVRVGDMVKVKVINIDEQGRINLSLKQAL